MTDQSVLDELKAELAAVKAEKEAGDAQSKTEVDSLKTKLKEFQLEKIQTAVDSIVNDYGFKAEFFNDKNGDYIQGAADALREFNKKPKDQEGQDPKVKVKDLNLKKSGDSRDTTDYVYNPETQKMESR